MPGLKWQRSTFCGGGGNNCVEVAIDGERGSVAIRSSVHPEEHVIIGLGAFSALIGHLRTSTAM
ncbi:DUF397 domain-containing protein [Streptomyces montanisoli]|uniref:DUF397 domain-containing protein n=1 Tax=Streptomyces montanisoli TaxID=2798581 RepID=A0A940MCZ6_9ACTN|nr:DUF397 domain-containing protein [Streptomyces montanisoli]MBP0458111.1 DUF397 domain-containing protein [Streptomyces montanisoli]